MKIVVVGAGIGGPALAHGLLADGHTVHVLERSPVPRPGGAAVTVMSNGAAALAGLGVPLGGLGGRIDTLRFTLADGRPLWTVDVEVLRARHGFGTATVPRAALATHLLSGLPDGVVRHCSVVVDVDPTGRVRLDDGSLVHADVVVGADGTGSVVRRTAIDPTPARDAGWATWQGLTTALPEITAGRTGMFVVGDAGFVGLMPAGGGLLQWWFDVPRRAGEPLPPSPVAWLRERFAGYPEQVTRLLAGATDTEVALFPHATHQLLRPWGRGRATLLGDAAHAFPPSQAQGANQALDDAWLLRQALRPAGVDVASALRRYERARHRRVRSLSRLATSEITNRPPPAAVAAVARHLPPRWAGRGYARLVRGWSSVLSDEASSLGPRVRR